MTDLPPLSQWAEAFAWTIAIETPIYLLWLRKQFKGWWTPIVVSLVANALTHPALWYVVPMWEPYHEYLYVAEAGVAVIEAGVVFAALRLAHVKGGALALGCAASFTANALSTIIGLRLFGE